MSEATQQTIATSPLKAAWKAQILARSHLSLLNILKQFSVQSMPQESFSQQDVWQKKDDITFNFVQKTLPFFESQLHIEKTSSTPYPRGHCFG